MKKIFWTMILALGLSQALSTGCSNNSPTSPAPMATPYPTATNWAGYTSTITFTPTFTYTYTFTPIGSATPTPTFTFPAGTGTPTFTFTNTFTFTGSYTPTIPFTPTNVFTNTPLYTSIPTSTASSTPITPWISFTPTITSTPTLTFTPTNTFPLGTDTPTATNSFTATNSPTFTLTPTNSLTPTSTLSFTNSPTLSPTNSPTETPTITFSNTPTDTFPPGVSPSYTFSFTPTWTFTFTPTNSFTPTNTSTSTYVPTPAIGLFGVSIVNPNGLAVGLNAGVTQVYVAQENGVVQVFGGAGTFVSQWTNYNGTNFVEPYGVAVNPVNQNVFVLDRSASGTGAVYEFTSTGVTVSSITSLSGSTVPSFSNPEGIAMDGSENLYVADTGNGLVEQFVTQNGSSFQFNYEWRGGTTDFYYPSAVAVTTSASATLFYVADAGNELIQAFSNGSSSTSWPTMAGSDVYGLTLDVTGNVYAADVANSLVEEYSASGAPINAWNGSATNYPGFSSPDGLVWLDSSHLLVADYDNGPTSTGSVEEFP